MSDSVRRHRMMMCGYRARSDQDIVTHLRICKHPACKKFIADAIKKLQAEKKEK